MKQGLLQESHPFDLITHHLFEIARQLIHQRMRKVLQAQGTYLALKSNVLLFIWMNSWCARRESNPEVSDSKWFDF